ncbi:LysR family transcriptional regulator [Novosphingobium sp. PASSN1]|uniref:LysR family transcriptional regulator n=1 Tax=Novosphingobium sp. PASSN1 TaxID=2015561 RepID=UPI000BD4EFED|nr:LysR family transcriptional regulator [Novosphingobium sp. PASSN1]OYU35976.1 MAG: LysR family transcriptional regulator [Novosphingobium sp. PASSN1]
MLNRRHLRQFLALVDTGSFTAAANQLHVAQPTLSAGIAELERALGAAVIVRERRALRLTEAGNRLLIHARAIEREFGLAERGVLAAPAPAPPLRLGVIASLATRMVAGIAGRFAPGRLTLTEAPDADLRRRLAEHRLDAVLTTLHGAEAGAQVLLEEGYAMILPAAHRFAARDLLLPEELAGETMIARRACEILAETSRFFTARGVRPHFALRSANDDRCLALVAAGAGVTTAPVSLVQPGTVAVPLQGYDYRRRIGLIVAGGQEDLIAASGLAPTLREVLAATD